MSGDGVGCGTTVEDAVGGGVTAGDGVTTRVGLGEGKGKEGTVVGDGFGLGIKGEEEGVCVCAGITVGGSLTSAACEGLGVGGWALAWVGTVVCVGARVAPTIETRVGFGSSVTPATVAVLDRRVGAAAGAETATLDSVAAVGVRSTVEGAIGEALTHADADAKRKVQGSNQRQRIRVTGLDGVLE